jgi:hypothetical protein
MPTKHPDYFHGKVIHEITTSKRVSLKCGTRVPPKKHLLNFYLKTRDVRWDETWLVLDNYGNETLPPFLVERIFGQGMGLFGYTIAISRKTGLIYMAVFYTEKRKNSVVLTPLNQFCSKLPEEYLPRLDELKSCKRPFYLTLTESTFGGLLDHEVGYGEVEDDLVVDLEFKGSRIQVHNDKYRLVSNWR